MAHSPRRRCYCYRHAGEVARIRSFDEAFRSLYGPLVNRLTGLTGSRAAAEDVAQEAFLTYLAKPPRHEANLAGWLQRVAVRLALNRFRGERRRQARERQGLLLTGPAHRGEVAPDPATDAATDPATGADRAETVAAVRAALSRLPSRDQAALLMRYHGYRYAEIAAALGVEATSVGTLLARAQTRFRKELEGEGLDLR